MKKFKGFIAALTALATVASSASVVAFAQSGEATGTGSVEGIVKKEVFDVVLPTINEGSKPFDFILDPQGLIAATSQAAYSGKKFESGKYLFFALSAKDAQSNDYASSSDAFTAYNLSSAAVDLTIKGTVTDADGIKFVSTPPAENAAEVKLAIDVDGAATEFATAEGVTSATVTKNLAALPSDKFDVKYTPGDGDAKGTYSYAIKDEVKASDAYKSSGDVAKATFKLVGEASQNDDGTAWANLKDVAPTVDITWEIKSPFVPESVAPSATDTAANATKLVIPFDLGTTATTVSKVEYKTSSSTAFKTATLKNQYSISNNTIVWIASASKALVTGSEVKITFDDGTVVTVNIL